MRGPEGAPVQQCTGATRQDPLGCQGTRAPAWLPPAEKVREPLELFPISPSGPLGVRSGTVEAAAPATKPAGNPG